MTFKIAVDAGCTFASHAMKPFHNCLVNANKQGAFTFEGYLSGIDFIQIILVVCGKNNTVEEAGCDNVKKIRGHKAIGIAARIPAEKWEIGNFETFKIALINLLNDSFVRLEDDLEKRKSLLNKDLFRRDCQALISSLNNLHLNNMHQSLTLIPEAIEKSFFFWQTRQP